LVNKLEKEKMKPKILLVEDDPGVLLLLINVLSENYDVIACAHCDDGLERLRNGEKFDAVWTDFDCPTPRGGALITDMAQRRLPGVPTIVASGNSDHQRIMNACKATAYLFKPFTISDVTNILAQYVGHVQEA
jgi:DNA-binding NtrC family response regulator